MLLARIISIRLNGPLMKLPRECFLRFQSSTSSVICRCISKHAFIGGIKNLRVFSPISINCSGRSVDILTRGPSSHVSGPAQRAK